MVIVVEERAIIATVSFVGFKEFDQDVLLKSLREAGIGEGLPFDKALVDRAEQEIKRQYLTRSLYGAEVVTTVTPIERNRVNVTFTMTEGEAASIREIRIVGATAFSESTLARPVRGQPGGWLSWYTKADRYSRAKLNADLETLRAWYLNRGFLEFAIESTQVTISPDKQDITVTITIREGQVFTPSPACAWRATSSVARTSSVRLSAWCPGRPYRGDDVAAHGAAHGRPVRQLRLRVRACRAAARNRPRTQRGCRWSSRPTRCAGCMCAASTSSGNTRTRDEVVRREFRQFESSWYDGAKIKLSKDRLDRWATSRKCRSTRSKWPARPTRWT